MKIGFVYDMIYPFSKGGAEKRIYHLASRLAKRHEVHWLGLKKWSGPSTLVTQEGVVLHGLPSSPGQVYVDHGRRSLLEPLWFGLSVPLWPGLRKMDVIDCCTFPFFSVFSTRTLALLRKVPVVMTWHEFWGDYWNEYAPRIAGVGRAIERMALRLTPHAITVSGHTRDKLLHAGLDARRIAIVPNGIDVEAINRAPALPNGPSVLYVGRLIPEKRVDALLQAMSERPLASLDSTCWIVGNGPDLVNLKQIAHRLQLHSRVEFKSWMSEDEVYGAMKSASLVALPSQREGFGMVVLEAMACGTPVVVASGKNSAAPELVENGESGYVVPCEPGPLSEALASIITSPQTRSRMGLRGRELAASYDWDRIADQAEAVYEAARRNGT